MIALQELHLKLAQHGQGKEVLERTTLNIKDQVILRFQAEIQRRWSRKESHHFWHNMRWCSAGVGCGSDPESTLTFKNDTKLTIFNDFGMKWLQLY
jgi:hypothetical protein